MQTSHHVEQPLAVSAFNSATAFWNSDMEYSAWSADAVAASKFATLRRFRALSLRISASCSSTSARSASDKILTPEYRSLSRNAARSFSVQNRLGFESAAGCMVGL